MKNLEDLTKDIVDTFNQYDAQGTKHWDYKTATFDLAYQLGSLVKRVGQYDGTRYADELSKEELLPLIGDELADILAETLFIAHELNIDMNEAWESMLRSDADKIKLRS